ncbi:Cof-type HAD-IIB family hydrolase [Actinocorallia lasiicapitis]
MPKLIATDLDGTLLGRDGRISPRTVAALHQARSAGAGFVIVTGRPPRWIHDIAEQVGHTGTAICANGAVTYDLGAEQVVSSRTIAVETIVKVVERLRQAVPELHFAVEYTTSFVYEAPFRVGGWDPAKVEGRVVGDDELFLHPAIKILALHQTADPTELAELATREIGDLTTVTHSSNRALLEISALGVTKATGLADYASSLGLTAADVVAFGDMPNDLPMLTWAGLPYAMANAHPSLLAAVPNHAAPHDEDGVAQILERLYPAT